MEAATEAACAAEPRALPGSIVSHPPPAWRKPTAVERAEDAGVCWGFVRGSPWWPCQLVRGDASAALLAQYPRQKRPEDHCLVQFCSTNDFSWLAPAELFDWKEGLRLRKDASPRLDHALAAAAGLLEAEPRRPRGWWSLGASEPNPVAKPAAGSLKRKLPPASSSGPVYVKIRKNEWAQGLKAPKLLSLEDSFVCQCEPPAEAAAAAEAQPPPAAARTC